MACIAYGATKMTHRDKPEMIRRAKYLTAVCRQYGITLISPVLKEGVPDIPGPLENHDKATLQGHWADDKRIIRYEAHVNLIDGAQVKSYGIEREYGLSRWLLWKPTVLIVDKHELSVADFEDDYICTDAHQAAALIRDKWGTWGKRAVWRFRMLVRCLPRRIYDEFYQWR